MKRLLNILLILLAMPLAAQDKGYYNNARINGYRPIWFDLGQRTEYGSKYSGALGTYTVKHNPVAIYAPEVDKTFFVYGGTPDAKERYLLCMAGTFDHKTGKVRKPTVVYDKKGVDDPHDNPSLLIDKDGYIFVYVAGRSNKRPGYIYKSVKPYDTSEFKSVGFKDLMAYPQPWYQEGKGHFLFCTRYDGVRRLFYRTSPDGVKWSPFHPIANIIPEGETKSGHYQITARHGNKLVSAFNRHKNGDVDTRTNMYFIQTEDFGKTWTLADGTPIKLPVVDKDSPARVIDAESRGQNLYIKDVNFDEHGNPIVLYLTSWNAHPGPQGDPRQWFVAHFNGKKWLEHPITTSTHNYDSGSIYVDGKLWRVIAPTGTGPQRWGTGGEVESWVSSDEGKTWSKEHDYTKDSPMNHSYMRRPVAAKDPFYTFWADGNPDAFSKSHLYFADSKGNVFRMPYVMKSEWESPDPIKFGTAITPAVIKENGRLFEPDYIKRGMLKVADWQLAHPRHAQNDWTNGAFYAGIFAAWETTKSKKLYNAMMAMGEDSTNWCPRKRWYHADDIAICQTYIDLYRIEKRPEMIDSTVKTVNRFINEPYVVKNKDRDVIKWWWCDALFMAPPVLMKLGVTTGDRKYIDAADKYFKECYDLLFNKKEHLFARDNTYIETPGREAIHTEDNGKLMFWGRGNGWVMGGLARILQELPETAPERQFYVDLYKEMSARLVTLQQPDGMWRTSLLNPEAYPNGEVSGTGFICYALAWGLNNGVLTEPRYRTAVEKAWIGLNRCVHTDGMVGWVQPIGAQPKKDFSPSSWEVYGSGAYLLAGSEVIKLKRQ